MPHKHEGSCHCGKVTISIKLSQPLDNYAPRACDCDFCTSRGITYLSASQATAEVCSLLPLKKLKQGSRQAQFLSCVNCDSVVAVVFLFESGHRGAVNAALLNEKRLLQQAVTASPKLLDPIEKVERWQQFWMPVRLREG